MTSKLGAIVARKVGDQVLGDFSKYFKTEEPFYYDDPRSGKKKRKKSKYRAPGVSEHDNKVLASVRKRAWRLDMCLVHCCGFRFGWAAVLELLPVVGDALGFLLACWVIRKADEIEGGLPPVVRAKMYFFAMIDLLGGLIPLAGVVFDAIYKSNTRTAWLLEDYLVKKAKVEQHGPSSVLAGDIEMGMATPPRQPQTAHKNGGR
ncbi:hypothetical protein VM1G_00205 [Cytospora mali]|uniref:Uncharacterized protein n=1 Tax=Cytospora mali TaxID=578113 RepID=A0A194VM62_CYTMA|nr:hypothetical protein VM1G_00205 [Valsa mali]